MKNQKRKILIVDDSQLDRSLTMEILRNGGVQDEFLEASNGDAAIEALGHNYKSIRLILLDWQMPVMSGLDFLKNIVNVSAVSSIPIVMVTVSGSNKNKKEAQEANPRLYGYVVKPYEPQALIEAIKSYTDISVKD